MGTNELGRLARIRNLYLSLYRPIDFVLLALGLMPRGNKECEEIRMVAAIQVEHGFADVAGAQLAYDRAGPGSSVVLLHGAFLDRRMWHEQFDYFARRFGTVRNALRSAGQCETQPSTEPFIIVCS